MEKIKLSFEPTESWLNQDFRDLITQIKNGKYNDCDKEYELWIITTNDNLNYINTLATQLDIPTDRVQMALNNSTKVGLIVLNSDIHLDNDQSIINTLRPNTTVESVGILVDRKIDYPGMGFKYIKDLNTWTTVILRERSDYEKTKPC